MLAGGNPAVGDGSDEMCDVWRCAAYCARATLGTCKEMQFSMFCESKTRMQTRGKCQPLDCSGSWRVGLMAVFSVTLVVNLVLSSF